MGMPRLYLTKVKSLVTLSSAGQLSIILVNDHFFVSAAPFLQMADQMQSADDSCPNSNSGETVEMTTVEYNASVTTDSSPESPGFNPVGWTYVISGAFTLVMGFLMSVLAIARVAERLKINRELETENREEEPLKKLIWLFIPTCFCYFTLVTMEIVYQSYIYSVSLCSEAGFSVRCFSCFACLGPILFLFGYVEMKNTWDRKWKMEMQNS